MPILILPQYSENHNQGKAWEQLRLRLAAWYAKKEEEAIDLGTDD